MKVLRTTTLLFFVLFCFSCDNKKHINFPENKDITILEAANSETVHEIEDSFRVIIVGDFSDRIHVISRFQEKGKNKVIVSPFFYNPGTVQKASYISFSKEAIPNNFMVLFWNGSDGKGEIWLKEILFKYKNRTKTITAQEFADNFITSDYLHYDQGRRVLTVRNHNRAMFRSGFYPRESLIEALREFTRGDGFGEEDTLIGSEEHRRIFSSKGVSVTFNVNIKKEDDLVLYCNTGDSKGFPARLSDSQKVEPGDFKNVTFHLEISEGNLSNLRFDYASVEGQEVQINSVKIKKGNSEFTIDQADFSSYFWSPDQWNSTIDKSSARYGAKKHKDKIDSKLIGTKKLAEVLENL